MASPFGRLVKDVAIYGAGRAALQLLSFVTLPVFTRIFTPAEYGVIETIGACTSVVVLLSSLGLESASQRSYFDYGPQQEGERRAVLSTAFWTVLGWSTLLTAVCVTGSRVLAQGLLRDPAYGPLLALALLAVPIGLSGNFTLEILRLKHEPVHYSVLSFFRGVATAAIALYLVALRRWGLWGYYIGHLAAACLAFAACGWVVRDSIRALFCWRELRVMLAYGLPLVPVAACLWVLQLSDRFFLLRFASREQLGLYGLGVRLSNLLTLAVTAFGVAYPPFMLDLHARDPEGERRVRADVLSGVTLVLAMGAVCLSLFAREFFVTITAPAFEEAHKVVGLLCGSIVASGFNSVAMTGITLSRQTRYFAWYTLVAAGSNILLNAALIPRWGMIGAALATMLASGVLSALYYWRSQQLDPAPYKIGEITAMLTVAAAYVAAGFFVRVEPLWAAFALKALLAGSFPVALWLLGILDARALARVRHVILPAGEAEGGERP